MAFLTPRQEETKPRCIRIFVTENATRAKCQQQLADSAVGDESGPLLADGLQPV